MKGIGLAIFEYVVAKGNNLFWVHNIVPNPLWNQKLVYFVHITMFELLSIAELLLESGAHV